MTELDTRMNLGALDSSDPLRYCWSHGAWRSLAARLLWEQEVAGSNPAAPTTLWPMIAVTGASGGVPELDETLAHLRA